MSKLKLIKLLDKFIGHPICILIVKLLKLKDKSSYRFHYKAPQAPFNILVIRPGGIGDAVLILPLLASLKRKYPSANLYVLAEKRNAAVFYTNPFLKHIFLYDIFFSWDLLKLLFIKFDIAIDSEQFHYSSAIFAFLTRARIRCGFNTNRRGYLFTHKTPYSQNNYEIESFLSLYYSLTGEKITFDYTKPFFPLDNKYLIWAKKRLAQLRGKITVTILPGTSVPQRRWPIDNYTKIVNWLLGLKINVVLCGGKKDIGFFPNIKKELMENYFLNLSGKTSIPQIGGIIAVSDLFLSSDTGILHLAYALGRPTLSLFGPGIIEKWAPKSEKHLVITKNLPCSPCTKFGYTPSCPNNLICMKGITVREIKEGISHLLKLSTSDLQLPRT